MSNPTPAERSAQTTTWLSGCLEALRTIRDLTTPGATSCEYNGEELLAEIRAICAAADPDGSRLVGGAS